MDYLQQPRAVQWHAQDQSRVGQIGVQDGCHGALITLVHVVKQYGLMQCVLFTVILLPWCSNISISSGCSLLFAYQNINILYLFPYQRDRRFVYLSCFLLQWTETHLRTKWINKYLQTRWV